MERRYITVDVFSDQVFGGNPLAVVLDAEGLSAPRMQSIAAEFNYSETSFILPPRSPQAAAHVRIFTPRSEVPFAGHPNVGTAVVFAREREAQGSPPLDRLVFEEAAGLVPLQLMRQRGAVVGAELTAPQPLTVGASVSIEDAAACLTLPASEIEVSTHAPHVLSVGLAFLVVQVASREALRRARGNVQAHERTLPPIGADAVYAYSRRPGTNELQARMFAPLDGIVEDPATGSATAAAIALLATKHAERDGEIGWRIEQGVDMGRPSLILGRTPKRNGAVTSVHVGGHAVPVMRGTLEA
jgi:trans-2,3-dihydro-3-hydroxyanthranilate isomerase